MCEGKNLDLNPSVDQLDPIEKVSKAGLTIALPDSNCRLVALKVPPGAM